MLGVDYRILGLGQAIIPHFERGGVDDRYRVLFLYLGKLAVKIGEELSGSGGKSFRTLFRQMPNPALFDEIPDLAYLYRIEVEIRFPADDTALGFLFLSVSGNDDARVSYISEILISPPLASIAFMAANTISACLVGFFSLMLSVNQTFAAVSGYAHRKAWAFLSV